MALDVPDTSRSPVQPPIPPPGPSPIPAGQARIDALDLARVVAMLGMLVVHYIAVWVMSPKPATGDTTLARILTYASNGQAMPLFVVLGGIGASILMANRSRPVPELLARALVLLVLGLVLEGQTPVLVILHFYALYLVLALVVRRLPDNALLLLAGFVCVVGAAAQLLVVHRLPRVSGRAMDVGPWGALELLAEPGTLAAELTLSGEYALFPSLAFFLVGMWLGRRRLHDRRFLLRLLAVGVLMASVAYGVGALAKPLSAELRAPAHPATLAGVGHASPPAEELTGELLDRFRVETGLPPEKVPQALEELRVVSQSSGISVAQLVRAVVGESEPVDQERRALSPWQLLNDRAHSQMPLWVLGAAGVSLSTIAGAALLCLTGRGRRWVSWVSRAGQLALTFYVLHVLLLRWPLGEWPYDLRADLGTVTVLLGFAGFVVMAALWRGAFGPGPLERALRLAGSAALAATPSRTRDHGEDGARGVGGVRLVSLLWARRRQ